MLRIKNSPRVHDMIGSKFGGTIEDAVEDSVENAVEDTICFSTNRLMIRDHLESDLMDLASLISSEKEMHFLMDIYAPDLEAVRENLKTAMDAVNAPFRDKYFFAIIEKATGKYVGEIGFTVIDKTDQLEGNSGALLVELGYFIKSKFWGRGYVVEAAHEVIRFAFNTLNTHKIMTGCVKENVGSEKVMLKLGFIKEGELRQHQLVFGEWKDRVLYGLLKSEYLQNNR